MPDQQQHTLRAPNVFGSHYSKTDQNAAAPSESAANTGSNRNISSGYTVNPYAYIGTRARVAIYDDLVSAPRVIDIEPAPILDYIENITNTTYEHAKGQGGKLPYTVIREIAENFIHANFKECVVSVLDGGNTIHFSDQGPGIEKKHLVLHPGVSSAVQDMKHFIRGVGSGFPIVKEYLELQKGHLLIEDNAQAGVIITLSISPTPSLPELQSLQSQHLQPYMVSPLGSAFSPAQKAGSVSQGGLLDMGVSGAPRHNTTPTSSEAISASQRALPAQKDLDSRAIQTLRLLYEKGILGPSDLMVPLSVSAATAHRVLVDLENHGLIEHAPNRKRILSSEGVAYYETFFLSFIGEVKDFD